MGLIKIDECCYIFDLNKFFKSHVSMINGNGSERSKKPYLERLLNVFDNNKEEFSKEKKEVIEELKSKSNDNKQSNTNKTQ